MKQLFLILLLPFSFLTAGQNWKWLNPLPQGRTINQLQAIDSLTAYAVADNGIFIRTTNGGVNWDITTTEYSNNSLLSLFFIDKNTGWLSGEQGLILYTNNGGLTFTQQSSGTIQNLYGITSNGSKVFSVGSNSTLLISSDNGTNWGKKELPVSSGFSSIYFFSIEKGYITCSDGNILNTTNGGESWNLSLTSSAKSISNITFITDNNGWACGKNGTIIHTINGGTSWESIESPVNRSFTSVSFVNNYTGIITANDGVYLRTTDGGNNWQIYKQDSTFSFNTVSFLKNGTGWIAGSSGILVKTTDEGASWDFQSSGDRVNFNAIKFLDPNLGYILGDRGFILKTTDGGNTWINKSIPTHLNLNDLTYYCWNNMNIIYVASDSSIVYKTNDFGDTWDTLSMRNILNVNLKTIAAAPFGVVAAGQSGAIGLIDVIHNNKYSLEKTPFRGNMTSSYFYITSQGYITGEDGAFYHVIINNRTMASASGGGAPYKIVSTNFTFSDLNQVYFFRGLGFIVGKYGVLLKTKYFGGFANGYVWTKSLINITNPKGVQFVDSTNGFICGGGGVLLRTTDGGNNWSNIQTNINTTLSRIWFVNKQTGFMIGPNGLFVKTDNGAGTNESTLLDVKESEPESFYLSQNYPNPFNPETSISYNLPQENFVSLKVFDLLGREVAVLKSEFQKQGKYNVVFDGSDLSSGIYFYVLRINDHMESRKMILLK